MSTGFVKKRCAECGEERVIAEGTMSCPRPELRGSTCGGLLRSTEADLTMTAIVDDSGLDASLREAVRRGATVEETGWSSSPPGRHQYRPVEVSIELKAVRTWVLEYIEPEGSAEAS